MIISLVSDRVEVQWMRCLYWDMCRSRYWKETTRDTGPLDLEKPFNRVPKEGCLLEFEEKESYRKNSAISEVNVRRSKDFGEERHM